VKIYNNYILILTIALLLTTVVLTALGRGSLGFLFTAYLLEAIIITELFVYFNTKVRRQLTFVGAVLFSVFLAYFTYRLIDILT